MQVAISLQVLLFALHDRILIQWFLCLFDLPETESYLWRIVNIFVYLPISIVLQCLQVLTDLLSWIAIR